VEAVTSFAELAERYSLRPELVANLDLCQYVKPTPVQKHAMPCAISRHDVMCCAQTGSGKTAAFMVPILCRLDMSAGVLAATQTFHGPALPQAVVLAPTRELCSQIYVDARKFTFKTTLKAVAVYGGVDARPQLKDFARSCDILVATPGRLTDFVDRGVMSFARVACLVLDEADRMLDMGFEPQIREIVEQRDMPSHTQGRQTMMFSATFPRPIQRLAADFMRDYVWISVGRVGGATETVEQNFIEIPTQEEKPQAVLETLQSGGAEMTIIFVAMKRTASWLCRYLNQRKIGCEDIHGDKGQVDRERSLQAFKRGRVSCLVATDVASRGLDIQGVARVINFDLPANIDDYVHRIGRTGRIGHRGSAFSFFTPSEDAALAPDLARVLSDAGMEVPPFVLELAQRRRGGKSKGKGKGKGFGGKGKGKGQDQSFGQGFGGPQQSFGQKGGGKGMPQQYGGMYPQNMQQGMYPQMQQQGMYPQMQQQPQMMNMMPQMQQQMYGQQQTQQPYSHGQGYGGYPQQVAYTAYGG